MASPFKIFRKNAKVLLVGLFLLSMISFVVIPAFLQWLQTQQSQVIRSVVVTKKFGELTEQNLHQLAIEQAVVRRFLESLVRRIAELQGNFRHVQALLQIIGQPTEEQLVQTWLLSNYARSAGMEISDRAVNSFLRSLIQNSGVSITDSDLQQLLASQRIEEGALFSGLARELLVLNYLQLCGFDPMRLAPETPGMRWEYFLRFNRMAAVELCTLPLDRYVEKAPSPTEQQISEFFEKYKMQLPNPNSPEPGFKVPTKATLEYVKGDLQKWRLNLKIPDEELRQFYEDRKDELFLRPAESSPTGPTQPAQQWGGEQPVIPGAPAAETPQPQTTPEPAKDSDQPKEKQTPTDSQEAVSPSAGVAPAENPQQPSGETQPQPAAEEKANGGTEPQNGAATPSGDSSPAASADTPNTPPTSTEQAPPAAQDSQSQNLDRARGVRARLVSYQEEQDQEKKKEEATQEKTGEETAQDKVEAKTEEMPAQDQPDEAPKEDSPQPEGQEPAQTEQAGQPQPEEKPAMPEQGQQAPAAAAGQAAPPPSEQPPTAPPAAPAEASRPQPEAAPAEASPVKAEAPPAEKTATPAAEKPAQSAEVSKYLPFEEVKERIRDIIISERIKEALDSIEEVMRQYQTDWVNYQTDKEAAEKAKRTPPPPPALPDVRRLAKEKGLDYGRIDEAASWDLEKADIGKSYDFQGTPFIRAVFDLREYFTIRSLDLEQNQYIGWVLARTEEHVPTLDEPGVRDQVIRAWRLAEARKLAEQELTRLAQQVNTEKLSLIEFRGKHPELKLPEVVQTEPFTWLTYGEFDLARMTTMPQPRISPVKIRFKQATSGLVVEKDVADDLGNDFMATVFALDVGETGFAWNRSHTTAYLVRVVEYQPPYEQLREMFVRQSPESYLPGAQIEVNQIVMRWIRSLEEDAGLQWNREPSRATRE